MKRYLQLQLKRVFRLLPAIFCVVAILFGSLTAVYSFLLQMNSQEQTQMKLKVGLVGTAGDIYWELGLAAMENFDSTRFAMELVPMEEREAAASMAAGEIAAYIVIPPNFMEEAFYGNILPLKYYGNAGAAGIVSLVKDELTGTINDILVETQKGIYGSGNAMNAQGYPAGGIINSISLEYVELVMDRSDIYSVTELGISDGLDFEEYLLSGLAVLFLMLICLPFGTLFIRQDPALARMLSAKQKPALTQICCESLAMLGALLLVTVALALVALLVGVFPLKKVNLKVVLALLPVFTMTVAFSMVIFEMAKDLISGMLLHFFLTLSLCFVCGCMYPVFFFPETVQKLAVWLPAGAARMQLGSCLLGEFSAWNGGLLLLYTGVFFLISVGIRGYRIRGIRG
jgi:ABC-type multidrug transport system permease subunit